VDLDSAARAWQTDGFVILPGFIPADDLTPAAAELGLMFPSAEDFHTGTDERRDRFIGDEFAGIDTFPFASTHLSLLAVHHRVLALACDYDQDLHRDYLNHTILVPTTAPGCRQVEMFVFLHDVRIPSAWTPVLDAETLAGMALRYPALDLTPWQPA
jgi:hypothetical protein